jgi:hypothetical protein
VKDTTLTTRRSDSASQTKLRELEKIALSILRERFSDEAIFSVTATEDVDEDGVAVLLLRVVLNVSSLDAKKASGLVRHLRSRLAEVGDERFPILSFLSKSDAKAMTPEAA